MRLPSSRPRALSRGFFVRFGVRRLIAAFPLPEVKTKSGDESPHSKVGRRAVTLFEVVVAVAIFLMVVAITAQALSLAGERARLIEHQNEAMQLAESQMARVIAGVVPLTSQEYTPFEHNPDYQWRMTAEEAEMTGLFNVQIWVQHVSSGANAEVQLCQKVFDPKNRGSTADQPGTSSTSGADGSSGAQTPASGTSGGT
jgi:type II secretory pathway pseudopilin PulG